MYIHACKDAKTKLIHSPDTNPPPVNNQPYMLGWMSIHIYILLQVGGTVMMGKRGRTYLLCNLPALLTTAVSSPCALLTANA